MVLLIWKPFARDLDATIARLTAEIASKAEAAASEREADAKELEHHRTYRAEIAAACSVASDWGSVLARVGEVEAQLAEARVDLEAVDAAEVREVLEANVKLCEEILRGPSVSLGSISSHRMPQLRAIDVVGVHERARALLARLEGVGGAS